MDSESQKENGHPKALIGGNLIDGTGGAAIENVAVVIEGDRISSVGKVDATTIPSEADLIDVTGKTVIPGFINCHAHFCLDWK